MSGGRGNAPPGRPSPTQKMDQRLAERFRTNPKGFQRSIQLNLLVVLGLLVLAAILSYFAFKVVGVAAGGLALATMALFPGLVALAALDDIRWRRALVRRKGSIPPPPPTLRELLRSRRSASAAVKGPEGTKPLTGEKAAPAP